MTNSPDIPEQHTGSQSQTQYSVVAKDRNDAIKIYKKAFKRLLNINAWEAICGAGADFTLIDEEGNETKRLAKENDYFKIDIPGPPNQSGNGYDWVKVEKIENRSDEKGEEESISITVRPSSNPENGDQHTDHFFSEEATSTFIVTRNGNTVTASVYGRNEIPNTETKNIADKVRNTVVAAGAIAAGSKIQWKLLVNGLLQ